MIDTYPAGQGQDNIRKVRPAAKPSRPAYQDKCGKWVRPVDGLDMLLRGVVKLARDVEAYNPVAEVRP